MDKLLVCANKFNTSLKFLARVYQLKKKGTFDEEKAFRTGKRLAIVVAEDPICLIEETGPFFLKYGNLIKEERWDEFFDMDFVEEKKEYGRSKDGKNHSNDAMDGKIKFIKKIITDASDSEKQAIYGALSDMLSAYCQYAIHIKNGCAKRSA